eukprot:scaffold20188_cov73-Attheya_sp.AAC.1
MEEDRLMIGRILSTRLRRIVYHENSTNGLSYHIQRTKEAKRKILIRESWLLDGIMTVLRYVWSSRSNLVLVILITSKNFASSPRTFRRHLASGLSSFSHNLKEVESKVGYYCRLLCRGAVA